MTPFLQEIAKQIIDNHKDDLNNVCVILPNRRSILYLKKYLCENIQQPTWSPKIWSIDDFVWEATHLQPCEKIDLLFDLFAIHRIIAQQNARNFDDFIQWGNMLLSDFDEIDASQVDAEKLFSYLSEAKAIELWNPGQQALTERERNYLSFYQSLSQYYQLLREKELNENKAWMRLAYRVFCDHFNEYFRPFENKHFYIVGFNALTTTEESLFKLISKQTNTEIIWDFDDYYMQPKHEAGFFLHRNFSTFGKPKPKPSAFKEKKNINIYPISKNVGQAIAVSRILQSVAPEENEDTAVILNDESLLIPIINFLPSTCEKFNITMSYSLKNTQLYDFIVSWLSLHTTASKNDSKFYYKELFYFLQHPFFQKYIAVSFPDALPQLEANISLFKKSAIPFLSSETIGNKIFTKATAAFQKLEPLFAPWNNSISVALSGLDCLVANLQECFEKEEDTLNLSYLFALQKSIHRLQEMVTHYADLETGIKSISYIFQLIFSSISIPFSGEPLGGLQIMGMLESRLLDFKNIIMVSVNEGMLPKNSMLKTFIPSDIRRQFQMPTLSEQNAISAHHFYRSIQRAENVHLLYNAAETNELGSNEKSRFITQLDFELQQYNPQITIINHSEALGNIGFSPLDTPRIFKDDQVLQRLDELAVSGFSPSAVNCYIDCSLKFYYEQVLKIRPQEDLKENIDNALLGSIVHEVIENLHQSVVNQLLKSIDIEDMLKNYHHVLDASFKKFWEGGNYDTGRNHLFYYVAKQFIETFLLQEKLFVDRNYVILAQEYEMKHHVKIETDDGHTKDVLFKGIADRICSYGNMTQVIDFKTGSVTASDVKIDDFDTFIHEAYQTKPKPKAIQLLMYAWLFKQSRMKNEQLLNAAIVSLQKPSQDFSLIIQKKCDISQDVLDKTELLLEKIVKDIFNKEIPFEATGDNRTCSYCNFSALCRWKNIKNSPTVAN